MPYFYTEVDVQVNVDKFISRCGKDEIEEMIEILTDEGHLKGLNAQPSKAMSIPEIHFTEMMDKIYNNRLLLTAEEEEILNKISKRF